MAQPVPVCRSILVCQQILQDARTQSTSLIGLIQNIRCPQFPSVGQVSVFSRWINGHGQYNLELHLRDAEDNVVWKQVFPQPCNMPDPLQPCDLTFFDLPIHLPGPGKFDLVLVANGEEVGRHSLLVHHVKPG